MGTFSSLERDHVSDIIFVYTWYGLPILIAFLVSWLYVVVKDGILAVCVVITEVSGISSYSMVSVYVLVAS